MEPIALKNTDGVAYAYACGRCHNVCGHGKQMRNHGPDEVARAAEFSLRDAEHCCRCRRCGGHNDVSTTYEIPRGHAECVACWESVGRAESEAQTAKWAAKRAADETKREAALTRALDREAALALETYMSDLSEEHYCAGWLIGVEDTFWEMVRRGEGGRFGMGEISAVDVDRMRRLSEKAGGWWRHDEFVPMAAWLATKEGSNT